LTRILLRLPLQTDLPILFEQQLDPKATAMASFPSRDRGPFMLHWEKIMKDRDVTIRVILYKGRIAGHLVCWKQNYEQEVGYWLGREFWGKGIASAALAEFLKVVNIRPLHAHIVNHNTASRRVLEKCGFVALNEGDEEIILKLDSKLEE
jgi:RimJ/RimL family protein N-acetyltransferase